MTSSSSSRPSSVRAPLGDTTPETGTALPEASAATSTAGLNSRPSTVSNRRATSALPSSSPSSASDPSVPAATGVEGGETGPAGTAVRRRTRKARRPDSLDDPTVTVPGVAALEKALDEALDARAIPPDTAPNRNVDPVVPDLDLVGVMGAERSVQGQGLASPGGQEAPRAYEAALIEHFLAKGGVPALGMVDLLGATRMAWSENDRYSPTFYRSVVAALRLLARLLELEEIDPADRDSMARQLRQVPLVWSRQEVAAWKNGGYEKYTHGCSKGDIKRYMATLADDQDPWEAFHFPWSDDNPGQARIWAHWLEEAPPREILKIVRRTQALFEAAAQNPALGANEDTLATNVGRVAPRLGLSPVQQRMWTVWLGAYHQAFAIQDVLTLACLRASFEEYEIPRWYELLGTALGGTVNDVEELFGRVESPLVRAGLLHARTGEHSLPMGRTGKAPSFKDVFEFHNMGDARVWVRRCTTDEQFVANFVQVSANAEPGLTLGAFEHLRDDVSRLVDGLRHERPVKLLLWGTPGSGKTQLAHLLLHEAGKVVAEPKNSNPGLKTVDHGPARMAEVAVAQRMAPMLGDAGLLVDECEAMLNNPEHKRFVNENLDQTILPQVWVANDLGGIHPAFLRRFDAVLHVPPMPLWAREKLAGRLFKDPALSQRVAQAMHTPAEVVRAHRWCESVNRFDWATVSARMAGYQRALMAVAREDLDDFVVTVVPAGAEQGGLDNLAGYPALRQAAQELTHVFSHPEHYRRLGAKVPRGVLLAGEPGTGKTLFARSVAAEVGVPIVMADSSSLADLPSRIGQLFAEARKHAPCMVFLDELDAIASNVRSPDGTISTDKQKILNRLLVELDGFEPLDGVLVIGATHRANALDPAVLRSGRLGRTIAFHAPHQDDRIHIWQHHTRGMPLGATGALVATATGTTESPGVADVGDATGTTSATSVANRAGIDWSSLAQASAGFSGADIAEAANLAALMAAQTGAATVEEAHLQAACDRVFWGEGSDGLPMSTDERWSTAVHEAGHALMAWKHRVRVERITVRPRATSLGAVHWTEQEGKHSMTRRELGARLEMLLGGIAAEEVVFGHYSNGGESDLDQAHDLLRGALERWGMSQALGATALPPERMSEPTLQAIEAEELAGMKTAFAATVAWLGEHRALVEELARHLMTVREMSGAQVRQWATARSDRLEGPLVPGMPASGNDAGVPSLPVQAGDGIPGDPSSGLPPSLVDGPAP